MSTQMIVRIDPALRQKVSSLAKAEGKSVSEVVRELLEEYVRDRDIGAYVDDLWERTGDKMKSRGFGPEDIRQAVREARSRT
jgi:predicted transcriptional regulator